MPGQAAVQHPARAVGPVHHGGDGEPMWSVC